MPWLTQNEQNWLGNEKPSPAAPSTELEATRLESEAELQLNLALTAQQMGDRVKAAVHTANAQRVYEALEGWPTC